MAWEASLFKVSHTISVYSAGFGYKTTMLAYEHMPHNKRMQSDLAYGQAADGGVMTALGNKQTQTRS